MIHRTAHFIVQAGKVDEAISIIKEFTNKVNSLEDGCLVYRSLQNTEDPREFLHYMNFSNIDAEDYHQNTDYVKSFVDKLYPLLEQKPQFTGYKKVAGP